MVSDPKWNALTIRLDEHQWKWVAAKALKLGISMNQVMRDLIGWAEYIESTAQTLDAARAIVVTNTMIKELQNAID